MCSIGMCPVAYHISKCCIYAASSLLLSACWQAADVYFHLTLPTTAQHIYFMVRHRIFHLSVYSSCLYGRLRLRSEPASALQDDIGCVLEKNAVPNADAGLHVKWARTSSADMQSAQSRLTITQTCTAMCRVPDTVDSWLFMIMTTMGYWYIIILLTESANPKPEGN